MNGRGLGRSLFWGLLALLAGCSNFSVIEPKDGAVVVTPAATRVLIEGNPRMSGVQVTVDGADVSAQIASTGPNRSSGNLNLPVGRHQITATADVDCSYCAGGTYQPVQQRTICVVQGGPSAAASKTAFAKADNRSWIGRADRSAGLGTDSGTAATRWQFRTGGIGSTVGLLESIEFPCLCLRSPDDAQESPVGLAICDVGDMRQRWRGPRMQLTGGKGFYRIENAAVGLGSACLTEGANNVLVQRNCVDADNQLWSVRNNTLNMFETEIHPWGN